MKLMYIANIRLPTEKAHGVQIMNMCEAFAHEGVQVELVVPKRYTQISEDPFAYYNVEKNFAVTRLPTLDTVSWGWFGFWIQTFSFMFFVLRYISSSSFDVLYSRDPSLFFFGRISSIKKLIWEVHTKPPKRVIERIQKLSIHIVTISNGLKEFLVKAGLEKNRILVAHDAVDIKAFAYLPEKQQLRAQLNLPSDKKLVAYIGKYKTMGESKGVEDIISAVGKVHANDSIVSLLVVGLNAEDFYEVEALVKRAKLEGSAYLVGHVPHALIPSYLKAADVLVMNYPNTEHYAHYMSPLKLFEYMASGTPIIASDLPSIREILDESNSLLVQNIQSLTSSIDILLHNSNRLVYAENAYKKVLTYTWDNRAKSILAFLN